MCEYDKCLSLKLSIEMGLSLRLDFFYRYIFNFGNKKQKIGIYALFLCKINLYHNYTLMRNSGGGKNHIIRN